MFKKTYKNNTKTEQKHKIIKKTEQTHKKTKTRVYSVQGIHPKNHTNV